MRKFLKIYFNIIIALIAFLPTVALGQKLTPPLWTGPLTLSNFAKAIIDVIMAIVLPAVVVMVVYTGFLFVSAQGNPEKLIKARTYLIWVLVGAGIVLGAQVIRAIVEDTVVKITP